MAKKLIDPNNFDEIVKCAEWIRDRLNIDVTPKIGVICGTGLNHLADGIVGASVVPYDQIPGFPNTTVEGHKGRLVYGSLEDSTVICLQGRVHVYEGHRPLTAALPVRLLAQLGVEILVMTSAVGGINPDLKVGDLMMVKDHISFCALAGDSPLVGPNDERIGPRFFGMANAYDRGLRLLAHSEAKSGEEQPLITLKEGVYAQIGGPQFETPAEIRLLRAVGADVVGMSMAHETIVARHAGLKVLAFSLITNASVDVSTSIADADTPSPSATSSAEEEESDEDNVHQEVLEQGEKSAKGVGKFVTRLIGKIGRQRM